MSDRIDVAVSKDGHIARLWNTFRPKLKMVHNALRPVDGDLMLLQPAELAKQQIETTRAGGQWVEYITG